MPTIEPLIHTFQRVDVDNEFTNNILKALEKTIKKECLPYDKPDPKNLMSQLTATAPDLAQQHSELIEQAINAFLQLTNMDKLERYRVDQLKENPNNQPMEKYLEEIVRPNKEIHNLMQSLFKDEILIPSGQWYYPYDGFSGWHTNCDNPVERIYVTYTQELNKSFFRYIDTLSGEMITDYDDAPITVRRFKCNDKEPYFWHCVGSLTNRLSYGFCVHKKGV